MTSNSGKVYRAALIGCGSMGSYCMDELKGISGRILLPFGHAEVLKTNPRTCLVAGADPDPERLQNFGERWGVNALYSDHRKMIETHQPEIVSIASPPDFHALQVEDCALSGVRGIFCEKPIATTLGMADRMISCCHKNGTQLAINHTRRGDPLILQARRLLDQGDIGQILNITATWSGRLFLSGTHWFDLANYFAADSSVSWVMGHLEEVESQMVAIPTQRGLDQGGTAYVTYDNGIRAFFNGRDGNADTHVEVSGSLGTLRITNSGIRLWKTDQNSKFRDLLEHPFPQAMYHTAPMVYLLENLLDTLETDSEPVSNGNTARNALELVLSTHESSKRGNVKVPLPFKDLEIKPPFQWETQDGSTYYRTTHKTHDPSNI